MITLITGPHNIIRQATSEYLERRPSHVQTKGKQSIPYSHQPSSNPMFSDATELGAEISGIRHMIRFNRVLQFLASRPNFRDNLVRFMQTRDGFTQREILHRDVIEFMIHTALSRTGNNKFSPTTTDEGIVIVSLSTDLLVCNDTDVSKISRFFWNNIVSPTSRENANGVQAINFMSTVQSTWQGSWLVVGFRPRLEDNLWVLSHEKREIGYRRQALPWIEAHNRTVDDLKWGKTISPEEAREYYRHPARQHIELDLTNYPMPRDENNYYQARKSPSSSVEKKSSAGTDVGQYPHYVARLLREAEKHLDKIGPVAEKVWDNITTQSDILPIILSCSAHAIESEDWQSSPYDCLFFSLNFGKNAASLQIFITDRTGRTGQSVTPKIYRFTDNEQQQQAIVEKIWDSVTKEEVYEVACCFLKQYVEEAEKEMQHQAEMRRQDTSKEKRAKYPAKWMDPERAKCVLLAARALQQRQVQISGDREYGQIDFRFTETAAEKDWTAPAVTPKDAKIAAEIASAISRKALFIVKYIDGEKVLSHDIADESPSGALSQRAKFYVTKNGGGLHSIILENYGAMITKLPNERALIVRSTNGTTTSLVRFELKGQAYLAVSNTESGKEDIMELLQLVKNMGGEKISVIISCYENGESELSNQIAISSESFPIKKIAILTRTFANADIYTNPASVHIGHLEAGRSYEEQSLLWEDLRTAWHYPPGEKIREIKPKIIEPKIGK